MPARRPQVSTLLRLHSARRRFGRSILGGYVASHVHGFQTSFELFDSEGHFPYYKDLYYGAVGQAAFGVLAIIISLVPSAICALRGH